MIRNILFLFITAGLVSCSTYSGPEYYSANPDGNNQNMGGFNEESYGEDISKLSMIVGNVQHTGATPTKARIATVNGLKVVDMDYEFVWSGVTYSFFMKFPDFKGEGIYKDSTLPVTITFHKKKDDPSEVLPNIWTSDKTLLVKVVKSDKKYIEATFEGPFGIFDNSGQLQSTTYVSLGEIRLQWLR